MKYVITFLLLYDICSGQGVYKISNGNVLVHKTAAELYADSVQANNALTDSTIKATAASQRAATISTLKALAYKIEQGLHIGATPSAAQQTAKFWIDAYNGGWINPLTGNIDSAYNGGYLK